IYICYTCLIFLVFQYIYFFFFFITTTTTSIYTLSLHDALPILAEFSRFATVAGSANALNYAIYAGLLWLWPALWWLVALVAGTRSEEHTSELQSRENLVCRLLLEKKKKKNFLFIEK